MKLTNNVSFGQYINIVLVRSTFMLLANTRVWLEKRGSQQDQLEPLSLISRGNGVDRRRYWRDNSTFCPWHSMTSAKLSQTPDQIFFVDELLTWLEPAIQLPVASLLVTPKLHGPLSDKCIVCDPESLLYKSSNTTSNLNTPHSIKHILASSPYHDR